MAGRQAKREGGVMIFPSRPKITTKILRESIEDIRKNKMTNKDMPKELKPYKLLYEPLGAIIYAHFEDGTSCRFMDVRGHGYLTGNSVVGAKGLDAETARKIQDDWAKTVVDLYNTRADAPPVSPEDVRKALDMWNNDRALLGFKTRETITKLLEHYAGGGE
jgi:hypothetical protein